jgi:NADPH-dependent glutamate synthase beta subunit-like oxidoreductase
VIRKEAKKILKYEDFTIEIEGMWIVKTKVITSNNMGNLNDLKLFQTTPEQNNWNVRNQRTTENSQIWALHTYCGKYKDIVRCVFIE